MAQAIQSCAPIAVLVNRIMWHCSLANESGFLHGLKYHEEPEWRVDGVEDLPSLFIMDYEDSEAAFAGASAAPSGRANTNILPVAMVTFMLACRRKNGLFARTSARPKGLLDWVSLIRDAMDNDEDGEPDALLKNTCCKPFYTNVQDNAVNEISWCCGIVVTLYPREAIRGTRRDLMDL